MLFRWLLGAQRPRRENRAAERFRLHRLRRSVQALVELADALPMLPLLLPLTSRRREASDAAPGGHRRACTEWAEDDVMQGCRLFATPASSELAEGCCDD